MFKDGEGKKHRLLNTVQYKLVLRVRVHIWSAQSSESLDCRASSHGLLRRDGGNLLWQHSDANVTQLLFDRLFRERGRERGDIICRFVIMQSKHRRCLWSGFRWMEGKQRLGKEGWRERRQGGDELCSKTWQQWGNCLLPMGSMQFIWRSEKWQLIIQPFPSAHMFYPMSSAARKNTIHPSTREGGRVTERVTDTEAVSRKDGNSLKCRKGPEEWEKEIGEEGRIP